MAYIAKELPADFADHIAMNAGVLLSEFDTSAWTVSRDKIIGATSGGVTFTDAPEFVDFGDDIDNCPKNMKELKQIDSRTITLSGTYIALDAGAMRDIIGNGTKSSAEGVTTITPSDQLADTDFKKVWFVVDYGDGGAVAIEFDNALSTGGFQIQSTDKSKAQFAFEYTAHYSMSAPSTVPYKVHIKEKTA